METSTMSGGQCTQFWSPSIGVFGPNCLGLAGLAPSAVAAVVFLLRYAGRPLWRRRPAWLRGFAKETDFAEFSVDGVPAWEKASWTTWTAVLLALSLMGAVTGVVGHAISHQFVDAIAIIPFFLSAFILTIDRPQATSGPLVTVYGVLLLDELTIAAILPNIVSGWMGIPRILTLCLTLASSIVILNMPLRDPRLGDSDVSKPFSESKSTTRSPEDNFTLWQWMTITWMAPIISIGVKRQINSEDVWLLPFEFQHARTHSLFRDLKGSVLNRLCVANATDLIVTTLLGILETVCDLSQIVIMKQLLSALQGTPPDKREALLWALLILLVQLVRTQSGVFSLWFGRRCYERSRGELLTMLYEKTIRRKAFTIPSSSSGEKPEELPENESSASSTLDGEEVDNSVNSDEANVKPPPPPTNWLTSCFGRKSAGQKTKKNAAADDGPASTGKIFNLMRSDAYEVSQRFWEFSNIFTKPLSFILSLVLIWRILGPSSLLGMTILVAAQVINAYFLRLLLRWEKTRRVISDRKLQQTTQFVEAIRHLRWYDWQDTWLSRILETRKAELRQRVWVNVVSKIIAVVNQFSAYMFPVAGFVAYTLVSGRPLTVDVAFPALDLFALLQNGLRELPDLVTTLLNASVAMGRIERFMKEPNKEEEDLAGPAGKLEIAFKDASFSWPGTDKKVLRDVTAACQSGLTVVCGKVGIGKTALLHAILGELDQHGAEVHVPHEMIGYTAQTPWLQSMSIRDNILFHAEENEVRYQQTLDACCLIPDLKNFKARDREMVGENGVGLSGGQRARVALARALYSQSRILLLDDPIAALDHQTAESILRKLFDGNSELMKGRLVVFVTHRVDMITRYADQVLEIVEGGHVKTFNREELENNEELQHLAALAVTLDVPEEEHHVQENEVEAEKLIEEEHRAHGGVMASVYWQYVKAGKLRWWAALVASSILYRATRLGYYWFLKMWGDAYGKTMSLNDYDYGHDDWVHQAVFTQSTTHPQSYESISGSSGLDLHLPPPEENVNPWLFYFFVISLVQVIISTISDFTLVVIVYHAGKRMFEDAMRRVANSTFRFYDVTPVGRLMNRLTSDIGTIDGQIAAQLVNVVYFAIGWISSVFVIASVTPIFLVVIFLMSALFVLIFRRFLPASQSLRRLEMVSLSPLLTNVGTLLEGLTTVRAFKAETIFQQANIVATDSFQNKDHFYWSLQSWLQYRFDALSAISTFTLTITALYSNLSSGTVAFVMTSAATFVYSTHALCRKYGELQMQFVSVERVVELLGLEQEPKGTVKPPASWPHYGDDIEFDNVTVRYAPNLEPSLTNVSFTIPGGSSVAVTGRTGSGKSTLALTLLGTILPDRSVPGGGSIYIGGVDLATVDKHALRRAISFVAQDPVLFPGTLRDNLDPLREHADADCARVLARVLGHTGTYALDSPVDAGGKNLSQGQRQLVGLGRAILRRSPVVVMDEATASIDRRTAEDIQDVLREELRESTVITIAHRTEAVRGADWKVVLESGTVKEAGPTGVGREGR